MPKKPKRCEECGERKPDVREMQDPFQAEVSSDEEPWMRKLCRDCAIARFEES